MSNRKRGTVYITGMFDMLNFGDLLFPLVAAHALDCPVVPVAPTATPPYLDDCLPPISFEDFTRRCDACDTVVIGGGHIVHTHSLDLLPQYLDADVSSWGGQALWLGASLVASMAGAAIAWNAPGAPHPLPTDQTDLIAAAARAADYLSLRDAASLALLPQPHPAEARVVPDPIAGIAALWPQDALRRDADIFRTQQGLGQDTRLWTLHIRDRSLLGTTAAEVARNIDALSASLGLHPVLCALGQAHDDHGTARAVAAELTGPYSLLDRPPSLRSMAGVLSEATVHSGSSLHGYMVSACFGVPALLLGRPAYRKFSGFLQHTGADDLARDWAEVFDRLPALASAPRRSGMPPAVTAALDAHWDQIRTVIEIGPGRPAERGEFLGLWMRSALRVLPPKALLRPLGKPPQPLLQHSPALAAT